MALWVRTFSPHLGIAVLAILLYYGIDYFVDLPPYGLVFESEIIAAVPKPDALAFDCEITMHATHSRKRRYVLAFPTRQDTNQAEAQAFSIEAQGVELPFQAYADGFLFTLPVEPGTKVIHRIQYTIPSFSKRATYVTRTANLWSQPIQRAQFILKGNIRSNYHDPGTTIAEFKDFRPRENWEVTWQ